MRLPEFEYSAPETIHEAVYLLSRSPDEAMVIAGGTDILPNMKQRRLAPKRLVDISNIRELEYIEDGKAVRIGTLTPLDAIEGSGLIRERYPMLAQAAGAVGAPQHRNTGTLGGNLCLNTRCWYYNQSPFFRKCRPICYKFGGEQDQCQLFPTRNGKAPVCHAVYSGDTAPALMALGADVSITGPAGDRVMPLTDLYTGDGKRPICLDTGDIVREVILPAPLPHSAGVYLKYRSREAIDFPLLGVAANIALDPEDGTCRQIHLVIGAMASRPVTVEAAGKILNGKKITDALIGDVCEAVYRTVRPRPNLLGCSARHRRNMARVFTRRAIHTALQKIDRDMP